MDILEKIEVISESGIRNIRNLSKEYNTAEIYFHKDLDGVTSAIGMKEYLKRYKIKTIDAHPLNYGGEEYAIPKPKNKTLSVLVDFAHGKPVMHIHTDHHDKQIGYEKTKSVSFVKSPSNAAYISQIISPRDLFPPKDAKIINTVDSADFSSQGIEPEEIMRAAFKRNPEIDVEKNHRAMGFVVNKLLLSYKNKEGFLSDLVMKSNPSLSSMYNVIKKLAKENGYVPPEELEDKGEAYRGSQREKFIEDGDISDIKDLRNGQQIMVGNLIVQYGGGYMVKGGYDRYTPFANHPEADYLCMGWPMGLVQISKNPFKSGKNPIDLGKMVFDKVLNKYKSKLSNQMVSLSYIKWALEKDIKKENVMGFTISDLMANYKDKLVIKDKDINFKQIAAIMYKKTKEISRRERQMLDNIEISAWDIIEANSGGHHDITNISGLNFLGKGYVDFLKQIMTDIAKQMKNAKLQ